MLRNNVSAYFRTWGLDVAFLKCVDVQIRFDENLEFSVHNLPYMRYVLVLPRKNAPVYQCFTLGTLKNLVCHVWWALQYLALWATNRN